MDDTRQRVQQRFGPLAQSYVTSTVHSTGYSLDRLIEVVAPGPGKLALDIATGGGHVALGLARAGATTIASDLTVPMLESARAFIGGEGVPASFMRVEAQHLPFADNSLDIVTCRFAAHHFPDASAFVRECARVVKPGGVVGLVDQLGPVEREAARYCNAFEKLRDPSHVWEYSQDDWETFFRSAGLDIQHAELSRGRLDFQWWTQMQNVPADDVMRLRVMLKQAPQAVAAWLEPELSDGAATEGRGDQRSPGSFSLWQLILVGMKV